MYHSFFIHSSVDGHLHCFHALAILNGAAMNIGVHVSFSIMVFSGYMPSSGIVRIVHFPGGLGGKESACSSGDSSLIPGWEDLLEKGMATHSSILAWRIPWTEEPGGLQSMGSQRVRPD